MGHDVEATSQTPALIVYLLDVSASMNADFEGLSRISVVNDALQSVLKRMARLSLKGTQIAARYNLAMIAYSNRPMDILGAVRPINEVIALGRPVLETYDATDTCAAFKIAKQILDAEIPKRQGLYRHPAPMVCHLTDGEYNGSDPEPIAREIMEMRTEDGNVLVENIFIGPDLLRQQVTDPHQWPGITDVGELRSEYAQKLFNMSSTLPESYAAVIQRSGYAMRAGARMLIPGGSRELIDLAFTMSGATPIGDAPRLASGRG